MSRSPFQTLFLAAAFVLAVSSFSAAQTSAPADADAATTPALKGQTVCPVMGGEIRRDLYVEKDGRRIFMCCPGCRKKISENFDQYAADMKAEGVAVERRQTECPVMGGKIDPKLFVEKDGARIFMCCPGCREKIEANFDDFARKMRKEGVTIERVQVKCPVCGMKASKHFFAEHGGKRIYACSEECRAEIKANFDEHRKKLLKRGVTVEEVPEEKGAAKENAVAP